MMNSSIAFLVQDCCKGRVELCLVPAFEVQKPLSVVFLCSANSARSLMAEARLNKLSQGRFKAFSAGTHPALKPNPHVLMLLQAKGYPTSNLIPKQIGTDAFNPAQAPDFVFTLYDTAANEDCPAWPGMPVTAHWGLPDPSLETGSQDEIERAFGAVYKDLFNRLSRFSNLPFETSDRPFIQARVDEIALM